VACWPGWSVAGVAEAPPLLVPVDAAAGSATAAASTAAVSAADVALSRFMSIEIGADEVS